MGLALYFILRPRKARRRRRRRRVCVCGGGGGGGGAVGWVITFSKLYFFNTT